MTDIASPPTIDALPPAPLPSDTPAEFNTKGFATVAAQAAMVTQVNASNAATHQNALASDERATAAETSRVSAATEAGTATTQAGLSNAARIAAQAAQGDAETAAGASTSQAVLANTARISAQSAQGGAEAARDASTDARDDSIAARDAAQGYRDQAQVFATQQLKGSSSTSLAPGAGNKTFAMEPSRSFVAGMYVVATSTGAPSARMAGYIVSYDMATGALVVAVDAFGGTGAHADWVIGVAAPGAADGITTQVVTANTACVANVLYVVAAAGITLTAPTAWAVNDTWGVTEAIGNGAQYTLAFGTTPLRSRVVGSQVLSAAFGSTGTLRYQNSTQGLA